jgi:hypothetical protein
MVLLPSLPKKSIAQQSQAKQDHLKKHCYKMSDSKEVVKKFRKLLECPICFEIKRGCYIFQCQNGTIA